MTEPAPHPDDAAICARILAAAEAARARGVRVVARDWNVEIDHAHLATRPWSLASERDGCACPLGALLLVEQPPPGSLGGQDSYPPEDASEAAGALLRRTDAWIVGFTMGVDGDSIDNTCVFVDPRGHAAGRYVAARLGIEPPPDDESPSF